MLVPGMAWRSQRQRAERTTGVVRDSSCVGTAVSPGHRIAQRCAWQHETRNHHCPRDSLPPRKTDAGRRRRDEGWGAGVRELRIGGDGAGERGEETEGGKEPEGMVKREGRREGGRRRSGGRE